MKLKLFLDQIPDKKIQQKNTLLVNAAKQFYGETIPQKPTLCLKSNLRSFFLSGKTRMSYLTQLMSYYNFPEYARWDYGHRFFGVSIFKPFEIYNKNVIFYQPRKRLETKYADPEKVLTSLRKRMWSIASCFVFPLLLSNITIKETKKDSFIFTNNFNDEFTLKFDVKTNQLNEVITHRYGRSGDFEKQNKYSVKIVETEVFENYTLPSLLIGKWDNQSAMNMRIKEVTIGKDLKTIMFAAIRK